MQAMGENIKKPLKSKFRPVSFKIQYGRYIVNPQPEKNVRNTL